MRRKKVFLGVVLLVAATVGVSDGVLYPPDGGSDRSVRTAGENTTLAFEEVSAETGFTYEAADERSGAAGMISDIGVYAVDVDRDGWTDVLAVGGDRAVLFENVGGEFQRSGALPRFNRSIRSALFVDYDADGWDDLLVLSDGRRPLLLENRNGTFERVDAGFDRRLRIPVGATTADYNRDGCPDLFVIQNGQWSTRTPQGLGNVSVPLDADNGQPNVLFAGTCSGFQRVDGAGIEGTRWSLATSFVDLTGDGWPDIHVANDFNRDIVYVNRGDGTFDRVVLSNRTDQNGMSSEIADVTGDGRPDIFTGNIYYPQMVKDDVPPGQATRADGNTLLVNRGNGTFVDRADELGLEVGGWAWAAVVDDFDEDMDQDVFHATRRMEQFDPRKYLYSPLTREEFRYLRIRYSVYWYPFLRERTDDGYARRNASMAGFEATDGRGVARLDFDRDGDSDLVVANADGQFKLYRNVGRTGFSLQIVLHGSDGTLPLGARVSVTTGGETQIQRYHAQTDFLSQDSQSLHFGTGPHARADVCVKWPDGTTQTFRNIRTNQYLIVTPDGRVSTVGVSNPPDR